MAKPELLVLDEPTNGLDPLMQREFLRLAREARDAGATILLSSHVLSEVQRLADSVIVIRRGRTLASGTVDDLRRTARQPFTAWFTTEPPEAALRAVPGVDEVEVRGREISGVIEGRPARCSRSCRHDVEHILLPEPISSRRSYASTTTTTARWHVSEATRELIRRGMHACGARPCGGASASSRSAIVSVAFRPSLEGTESPNEMIESSRELMEAFGAVDLSTGPVTSTGRCTADAAAPSRDGSGDDLRDHIR
jgi:hypothetical protein